MCQFMLYNASDRVGGFNYVRKKKEHQLEQVFVEVGALRLVLADFVSILSAPDTGSAYWALE